MNNTSKLSLPAVLSTLKEALNMLVCLEDVFKYYIQISLPLWAENKRQAEEISRLKVTQ